MIKLNAEQIKYLDVFRGLKSFARQDALNRTFGVAKNKEIEQSLVNLGVLKRDKRGSLRGPSWDDIGTMIRLSSMTLDQMLEEANKVLNRIKEVEQDIKRREETDPNFCFYSRDMYDTLRYNKEVAAQWAKDIQLAQRQTA